MKPQKKTPPKTRIWTLVCHIESQSQAANPVCSCTTSSTGCTLVIFQQRARDSYVWEFIGITHWAQPCIQSNHKPQGHWTLCSALISTRSVHRWITQMHLAQSHGHKVTSWLIKQSSQYSAYAGFLLLGQIQEDKWYLTQQWYSE